MRNDEKTRDRVGSDESCGDCPVAGSRRAFLRDVGLAAAAAVAAVAFRRPGEGFAAGIGEITSLPVRVPERSYAIPSADSVSVDIENNVILARWENRLYAFSLKCPHKGERLEWRNSEQRIFCPKHKARFLGKGSHVSGRGSRDLDRYAVRRVASGVVVDLGRVFRADADPAAWAAASVALTEPTSLVEAAGET